VIPVQVPVPRSYLLSSRPSSDLLLNSNQLISFLSPKQPVAHEPAIQIWFLNFFINVLFGLLLLHIKSSSLGLLFLYLVLSFFAGGSNLNALILILILLIILCLGCINALQVNDNFSIYGVKGYRRQRNKELYRTCCLGPIQLFLYYKLSHFKLLQPFFHVYLQL
jgi:hypothetical protein